MDPIDAFPDAPITDSGPISQAFRARGLTTFTAACRHVHQMPYGYNTTREDPLILFRENRGSCTTKHMAVGCWPPSCICRSTSLSVSTP